MGSDIMRLRTSAGTQEDHALTGLALTPRASGAPLPRIAIAAARVHVHVHVHVVSEPPAGRDPSAGRKRPQTPHGVD
jgi:hypothetical protein